MNLKGEPSLTKARVSLKNMIKSWDESDREFLVKCRTLIAETIMAKFYGIDEVYTVEESVPEVLNKFSDVFDWPEKLPPRREIEHHIHLKKGTDLINVKPHRYAWQQKEEMEKLVEEMLTSAVIRPSNSPYSSPVLLVKKKDRSWHFC